MLNHVNKEVGYFNHHPQDAKQGSWLSETPTLVNNFVSDPVYLAPPSEVLLSVAEEMKQQMLVMLRRRIQSASTNGETEAMDALINLKDELTGMDVCQVVEKVTPTSVVNRLVSASNSWYSIWNYINNPKENAQFELFDKVKTRCWEDNCQSSPVMVKLFIDEMSEQLDDLA